MDKKARRAYQQGLEADMSRPVQGGSRPIDPAQRCAGWRGGVHERAPHNPTKCRWCWQEMPEKKV